MLFYSLSFLLVAIVAGSSALPALRRCELDRQVLFVIFLVSLWRRCSSADGGKGKRRGMHPHHVDQEERMKNAWCWAQSSCC